MIELRTLGGLQLKDGRGHDLCGQLQPKRLALLIYLSQAPRRFHRRDSLLALFWPELDSSGGRNALRQSLHALRQCLGNGALVTRGYEEVAISERVWSDVVGFESALASGHPERALELYGGEFLEGLHVQNVASQFEHWPELKAAGAPLSYFITTSANYITDYDKILKEVLAAGGELGNHTVNHCNFDLTGCTTHLSTAEA